jgi:hypothetical protein
MSLYLEFDIVKAADYPKSKDSAVHSLRVLTEKRTDPLKRQGNKAPNALTISCQIVQTMIQSK